MAEATATTSAAPSRTGEGAPAGAEFRADPAGHWRRFLESLLDIQIDLVGGAYAVAFITDPRTGGLCVAAQINADSRGPGIPESAKRVPAAVLVKSERMASGLMQSAAGGRMVAGETDAIDLSDKTSLYGGGPTHTLAATTLIADGRAHGATVVVIAGRPRGEKDAILTPLALTIARFEAFLWKTQAEEESVQRLKLRETLELLDATQQGSDIGAMASIMCHELSRRFGCTRVSVGLFGAGAGRDRMTLTGVSGADRLDHRSEAARLIENAMEECADQDTEVLLPAPAEWEGDPSMRRVTRAHAELARLSGPGAMLSLPLRVEGELVGVLLLEREAREPFPAGAASLLRLVAEYLGPALWTRRLADRGIFEVVRDRTVEAGRALVGPRHTALKLVVGLIGLVLLLASVVPIPDRIRAEAEVKAAASRTIVPPFAGYIAASSAKPGDAVKAGQVLASMDTREIEAQLASTEQRRGIAQTQRDEARSAGELPKAIALLGQIAAFDADLRQLRYQLDNAEIKSPIDGVVGRGDIDQLVGARAEPTQALFEVVTDRRVAVLAVREQDVRDLKIGQTGQMTIRAQPRREVTVKVARITPMAEVVGGDNVYLVETEIVDPPADWLPGMTGRARLDRGWTTWTARILKPLVDSARMKLWI